MKNFCLYNGKKIVKPEIWNIASVELSSDYTSAIIQAESKSNKSEYTLDITSLISNQYENGIDPYSATIVNSLTGVSDWIIDPVNNQIVYTKPTDPTDPTDPTVQYYWQQGSNYTCFSTSSCESAVQAYSDSRKFGWTVVSCSVGDGGLMNCPLKKFDQNGVLVDQTTEQIPRVANPAYDPSAPPKDDKKTLPLETVAQQVISNAANGDTTAQNSIVSTFNNITDDILTSDYSEFFEQNKQPK